MATRRRDRLAARALAWVLFVGAWLVLGPLGRETSPLWFAGLLPIALWLATAGVARALAGDRPLPRALVVIAVALAVDGLAIGSETRNGLAVAVAAVGWGLASCAASRRGDAAIAPGCAQAAFSLDDASSWPALGGRWVMLPMMAALVVQPDWCAGAGLSAAEGVALHLLAMLAPAVGLQLVSRRHALRSPLWIVALMAAGVAMLPLVPGVRGWMAMSLLHAAAWSLAWSRELAGCFGAPPRRGAWPALGPAAALLALGTLIDVVGFAGLLAVHVALGAASLAGALAWWAADAWQHAHPKRGEGLS